VQSLAGVLLISTALISQPSNRESSSCCSRVESEKSVAITVAEKSLQWMPESLRRVLSRHSEDVEEGIGGILTQEFLTTSERPGLESSFVQRVEAAVTRLQARPRFSESAKDFGALAGMMLALNLPVSNADRLQALGKVIARNSVAFRIVVYDAADIGSGRDDMKEFLDGLRRRRAQLSERFKEVESTQLLAGSTGSLDPTSPLFGIAALAYTHAVNDTARIWLLAWRSANGDMAGRPSLGLKP